MQREDEEESVFTLGCLWKGRGREEEWEGLGGIGTEWLDCRGERQGGVNLGEKGGRGEG